MFSMWWQKITASSGKNLWSCLTSILIWNILRLQIHETGKVSYEKTLAMLSSETLENVRSRLAESHLGETIAEAREKGQRSWWKAVTGNPEKKIGDFMKEVPQVIPKMSKWVFELTLQVKFIDKVSFFFGVTCIIFTEFLALRHPEYFTQYYFGLITLLLSYRSQNRSNSQNLKPISAGILSTVLPSASCSWLTSATSWTSVSSYRLVSILTILPGTRYTWWISVCQYMSYD